MEPPGCFFQENQSCSRERWKDCEDTVSSGDVWFFASACIMWLGLTLYYMWREHRRSQLRHGRVSNSTPNDAIHDVVSQGVAVGEASRRHMGTGTKKFNLIRWIKLAALWIEWPLFTFTPLSLMMIKTGVLTSLSFEEIGLSLGDRSFIPFVVPCVVYAIVLSFTLPIGVLSRLPMGLISLYSFIYDLLFLPLCTGFARLVVCDQMAQLLEWPNGATCACLDHYWLFALVALIGFVVLYGTKLRYRADLEHTTLSCRDLVFGTTFQIIMVFAETCK